MTRDVVKKSGDGSVPVAALSTGVVNRIATVDSRLTAITFGVEF